MDRNKIFVKNTIILFIGKFTSQFMSLLLIPLFTHYLTTSDYGTIDLLQTIISLFIPVLSFRIDSAVFRYLIDFRSDNKETAKIITNTIVVLFAGVIVTIFLGIFLKLFFDFTYILASVINLILLIISSVLMQIQRGLGKNKEYSICCIIIGIGTLFFNICSIILLHNSAVSILWSASFANFIGIFYILLNLRLYDYIKINYVNINKIKLLLKFSLPMIPDYLSGWIVNVSDRTIVSFLLGTALNGIYTVSSKFSNILNSVFSIVNMSWQETAALHINDKDRNIYFSMMINNMVKIFSTIGLLMLVSLPLIYPFIVGSAFKDSYKYIPILIYANSWRVLVGTTCGIYIALKKTKEVANTTVVAAIINLLVHFALIFNFGLYAACISTLFSYLIMGLYRYFDSKKYVKINLDWRFVIRFTLLFLLCSLIYLYNNLQLNIISFVVIIIYSFFENKNLLFIAFKMLKEKVSIVF